MGELLVRAIQRAATGMHSSSTIGGSPIAPSARSSADSSRRWRHAACAKATRSPRSRPTARKPSYHCAAYMMGLRIPGCTRWPRRRPRLSAGGFGRHHAFRRSRHLHRAAPPRSRLGCPASDLTASVLRAWRGHPRRRRRLRAGRLEPKAAADDICVLIYTAAPPASPRASSIPTASTSPW